MNTHIKRVCKVYICTVKWIRSLTWWILLVASEWVSDKEYGIIAIASINTLIVIPRTTTSKIREAAWKCWKSERWSFLPSSIYLSLHSSRKCPTDDGNAHADLLILRVLTQVENFTVPPFPSTNNVQDSAVQYSTRPVRTYHIDRAREEKYECETDKENIPISRGCRICKYV